MRLSTISIVLTVTLGLGTQTLTAATAKPAVENAAPAKLQQFDWSEVTLNPGPLKDAFEANLKYLRLIEPDRLLLTFRRNAGIETSAQPYGGWEEPRGELRGHSMGHYLSACARAIAQTNDPVLKKNADYTVAELAKVQAKLGNGYLSAFPTEFFDRVEAGKPVWAPYYTIHKIMLGLWEMHAYGGNVQALDVLRGMADYFKSRCDKLDDGAMQKMLRNEFGGMHEVLLNLYSSTGEKKYLDLAQRFVKKTFIDPLADSKDDLPGIHANTHIPQIAGQARAYELTANAANRKIVEFFYNTLVSAHSYATGGSNVGEYWGPPNKLANTLSANNQEFCTSYNFEKICRYLLRWTGDVRYADMIERLYYNGILVSQDPQTGMLIYFLPFKTGLHKDHGTPFQTFTCCYGTGMQEYNSLAQDIYYHTADTLYVNLFAASTVKWNSPAGLVTLTQETDYPASEKTTLKLALAKPTKFKLNLRTPWWAEKGVTVRINGQPLTDATKPWITLDREWKDGDIIEMAMPMSFKLVPMPDDPKLAAIMYGPMVLAGLVDGREIQTGMPAPLLTGDMANPQAWIKPVEGKPLTFRTVGQPTDLTLIPIHKVISETYGLYWRFAPSASPELANYQSAVAGYRTRQARIIDNVLIGDTRSERAHAFQSQNSQSGNHPAGTWRHAGDGGFFSYRMRVEPEQANVVAVTYWGSDADSRTFDILADGTKIATQKLDGSKPDQLFVVEYPLPKELTANKQNVVIRFQPAAAGQTAGGIFGLATLMQQGPTTKPAIRIDAAKTGQPISKYIYGQFIEHLGRCIYGGIWAEMLEDRKFFYAVGVKESPWKPIGGEGAVSMIPEGAFVGQHTPVVKLAGDIRPRGIAQSNLALIKGKQYVGRIWLAGVEQTGPVRVSLIWGKDPADRQTITIDKLTAEFAKTPLAFTAGASTSDGGIEIIGTGSGAFRIGTLSLMPADNVQGFRADTLTLLRELNSPVYRWPGGNFVSGYNWKDGIGDPDRRPPRKNPAWTGIEHNDVGLDEFMTFCKLVNTDPYIAVNSGLGDVKAAAEEVEYANGSPETPMGQWRAKTGHREPYAIKFWSIGNEMYGNWQLGHMSLEQYQQKHNEFANAMRKVDPTIKLIGVGAVGQWTEGMLKTCANHMDLISEHFYCQERPSLAQHVKLIPDQVRRIAQAHRKYREQLDTLKGKDIRIALDEWNYWYGPHIFGELGTRYFLKDGLGIAAGLHEYFRNSDIIFMANYAQTVNVIGCIKTSKTAAAFETTGLVLKLYRQKFGDIPLATQTTGPVDAMAALSADRGTLTIGIVNPTMEPQTIALTIGGATLAGPARKYQITGTDPMAYNDPSNPDKFRIEESDIPNVSDSLTVAPCSVTVYELKAR